ncbi:MAG: hypothetical protein Q9203_004689 [Teloschistes exilis]
MRLLHTETLQFEEFFDTTIPKYAILSHRWGKDEVSFKEMRKGQAPQGLGLTKLRNFCLQARTDGYQWAWMDTCCIDKKSSAELSEAINSMYKWYRNSEECYVYLADVKPLLVHRRVEYEGDLILNPRIREKFLASLWFRRGWTLQELLAPRTITFYDANWRELGDKHQLNGLIMEATGIHHTYLVAEPYRCHLPYGQGGPSAAQKMSWVAKRETSRSEDMAYCLLGLFGINIPLLYGEGGRKAFIRLQTEIINKQEDESILAWEQPYSTSVPYGILAPHPRYFKYCGDIIPVFNRSEPRYWITNRGLALRVPASVFSYLGDGVDNTVWIPLHCKEEFPQGLEKVFRIRIMLVENICYRVKKWRRRLQDPHEIEHQEDNETKTIYFPLDSVFVGNSELFSDENEEDLRYFKLMLSHNSTTAALENMSLVR